MKAVTTILTRGDGELPGVQGGPQRRKLVSNLGVLLVGLGLSGNALADDDGFGGYSYFVLGWEELNYKEEPQLVPVHTNTHVHNIALRTGGLFSVNRRLDFSLDTGATLIPGTATETWAVSSGSAGDAFRNGLLHPGSPVQHNGFRLSLNSLQVLLQYKHTDRFRSVYGISYSLNSFKRFNWSTVQGSAVTLPQGAVEEDTSDMNIAVGVDVESGALGAQSQRWQGRALLEAPIWRQTTNTNDPGVTFSHLSGVAAYVQGSYNIRLYRRMEIGLYISYRSKENGKDTTANVELPKNILNDVFYGLQLSWSLSPK